MAPLITFRPLASAVDALGCHNGSLNALCEAGTASRSFSKQSCFLNRAKCIMGDCSNCAASKPLCSYSFSMSSLSDPGTLCAFAGLALVFLGALLLLSRLSAEAAKIRYDVNLLWTNKFDRCSCFSLHICLL